VLRRARKSVTIVVAAAIVAGPASVTAYETDQFSNRLEAVEDSTEVLNREVNNTIEDIVADWRKGHNEMALVNAIYRRIGGLHWVDKLERWAMKSAEVGRLSTPRYRSMYSRMPIWSVRFTFFFGIGTTIRVNDELIGSDKIGHFLSQGRKYYRRYIRYGSEARAAKRSAYTERAIFGSLTTGTYSNADLVANFEGYRFYRSLFEDDIVPGKPAILHWDGDGWIIQRPFEWADFVNEYWDEALNVSHFDRLLYKRMRKRLVTFCPQYWESPATYMMDNQRDLELQHRYAHLELRDTRELRLDALCPAEAPRPQDEELMASTYPRQARSRPRRGSTRSF
jgi:hypothetical protein